ncbi:MAG: MoaD/ThiS family protein [Micromonosporaceae bacterium]
MAAVLVRYFAGARAAAGRSEEKVVAGTLDELVEALAAAHGDGLARVLRAASFLVDETAWHDRHAALPVDATVDVLPPFAGG